MERALASGHDEPHGTRAGLAGMSPVGQQVRRTISSTVISTSAWHALAGSCTPDALSGGARPGARPLFHQSSLSTGLATGPPRNIGLRAHNRPSLLAPLVAGPAPLVGTAGRELQP